METNVYDVKGGTDIRKTYKFYRGSFAIVFNHANFFPRYSEICMVSGFRAGSIITQEQFIGAVSRPFAKYEYSVLQNVQRQCN